MLTRRLRRKRFRYLHSTLRSARAAFNDLESLDSDDKKALNRAALRTEGYIALTYIWWKHFRVAQTIALVVLLLVAFAVSYVFVRQLFEFRLSFRSENSAVLTLMAVTCSPFFLLSALDLWTSVISRKAKEFFFTQKVANVWIWLLLLSYGVLLSQVLLTVERRVEELSIQQALAFGLLTGLIILLTVVIHGYVVDKIRLVFIRRVHTFCPEAVIAHHFMMALMSVENSEREWNRTSFKRRVIFHLEIAAECLERDLPRFLRQKNYGVVGERWVEETFSELASAVRELNKWVITPKLDTLAHLRKRLAEYLVYTLRGDWDSFKRIQVQAVPQKELWQARIRVSTLAILSASIPLITLWIVKRLDILKEPIITYLTVGGYIWSALTLLSHLDPNYSAKLSAIKDIAQLLPGSKDKKD